MLGLLDLSREKPIFALQDLCKPAPRSAGSDCKTEDGKDGTWVKTDEPPVTFPRGSSCGGMTITRKKCVPKASPQPK